MKDTEDGFGHEIYDHFMGKGGFEILERDDGHIEVGFGPKTYFAEYQEWSQSEKEAMTYVKGQVLDIGCGAGRHALYLQEQGFDVLGIDNSPLAVMTCKLRGVRNARIMSITDLSSKLGTFDTILIMGSLGLLGSSKRARWLLRRFKRMTSEDARIIAKACDPYDTENPFHLHYHRLNRQRGRMPGPTQQMDFGPPIRRSPHPRPRSPRACRLTSCS